MEAKEIYNNCQVMHFEDFEEWYNEELRDLEQQNKELGRRVSAKQEALLFCRAQRDDFGQQIEELKAKVFKTASVLYDLKTENKELRVALNLMVREFEGTYVKGSMAENAREIAKELLKK